MRAGAVDTAWLDRLTAADEHLPTRLADVALVAAALDAGELAGGARARRVPRLGQPRSAARRRPRSGGRWSSATAGSPTASTVRRFGLTQYEIELDGETAVVDVERLGRARSRLTIGGRTSTVVSSTQGSDHLIEVDGVAHRFSRDDAGIVRAPAAALVVGSTSPPTTSWRRAAAWPSSRR